MPFFRKIFRKNRLTKAEAKKIVEESKSLKNGKVIVKTGKKVTTRREELNDTLPKQIKTLNKGIKQKLISKEQARIYLKVFVADSLAGKPYPERRTWLGKSKRKKPYSEAEKETWLKVVLQLKKVK